MYAGADTGTGLWSFSSTPWPSAMVQHSDKKAKKCRLANNPLWLALYPLFEYL